MIHAIGFIILILVLISLLEPVCEWWYDQWPYDLGD